MSDAPAEVRIGDGTLAVRPSDRHDRALVIGIGNPSRADDGIGPAIARRIWDAGLEGVCVRGASGAAPRPQCADVAAIIEGWDEADLVILIDAAVTGAEPGTCLRFEPLSEPMPGVFVSHVSSHGAGVLEAIDLAHVLGQVPGRLIVYGVVASKFEMGGAMSPEVASAADALVERIIADLRDG